MSKQSIRFYNDHEVRAVWVDEEDRWFFSIVDIVASITESPRPRVYWGTMKSRRKGQFAQLYSKCIQLKLASADGKRYATDCFAQEDIADVVRTIPSKNAAAFLDWFTYSDNSVDGRSRKKAYAFGESSLIPDSEVGSLVALRKIHAYLFGGLYDFAGKIRQVNIAKSGFQFAMAQYLPQTLAQIERMPENTFDEIVDKYVEMNIAHPFREGNGRSTRIWLDLILKKRLGHCVDWSRIPKNDYLDAMVRSVADASAIRSLLRDALTDKTGDRELFMKGIDYSYYYEQNN